MACDDWNLKQTKDRAEGDYRLPSIAAGEVLRSAPGQFRLIDVRKAPARAVEGSDIAGATWIDPFTLGFEHSVLRGVEPLVFFCVHGHEVSQFAAALALVAGCDARYAEGGFTALADAGARLVPLDPRMGDSGPEGRT